MRLVFILIGLLFPALCAAQVAILEVRWAGSEVSSADEWLLLSCTECPVDISGWSVTSRKGSGEDAVMVEFPEGTIIKDQFLISNYSLDKSALEEIPDLVTTKVSLPNTKLFLQLFDGSGSVIDSVDDGKGAPFAGSKNPYLSMVRLDLNVPGTQKDNWQTEAEVPVFSSSSSSSVSSSSSEESSEIQTRVIISEVLASPIGSDDYEWIEVANLGEQSIDITDWVLSDGSRSFTIKPRNASGYVLTPGEHTLFFHHQTGISLGSNGELITLASKDAEVDRLDVSATGEEISFGREADGSRGAFCIPTPRELNTEKLLSPKIVLQSGRSTDYVKVTLNLKAEVEDGSLKSAECFWDFKDGTTSKKCNPPSHTWDYYGVYDIELTVKTKCGDEIKRKLEVVVLQKRNSPISKTKRSKQMNSSTSSLKSLSISVIPIIQSSKSSIEQIIYTTSSASQSRKIRAPILPIRYRNIPSNSSISVSSVSDVYNQVFALTDAKYQFPEAKGDSGMPWILLFSQSAILVGIKAFRVID